MRERAPRRPAPTTDATPGRVGASIDVIGDHDRSAAAAATDVPPTALHRARRRQPGRSDGDGGAAAAPVAPGGTVDDRDRLDRARAAHVRAHRRDRQLLLHRAVVSQARRAAGRRAGTATSSTPRTEFFSDYGVYDVRADRAGRLAGRRDRRRARAHATTPTARRRIATTRRTCTTSRGRRAPTTSSGRARFEHPTLPPVEMRLLLQPEHAAQAERHFDATRDDAEVLRRVVRRLSRTATSRSSIRRGRAAPAAWSTRRCSPPARAGSRRARVDDARRRHRPRSRPPVLVRHRRQQRVRGRAGWTKGSTRSRPRASIGAGLRPELPALRYFGGFVPWVFTDIALSRETDGNRLAGYRARRRAATRSRRRRSATGPRPAAAITYNKTALWLNTLERYLGWPVLQRIMSTYFAALCVQASATAGFLRRRERGQRPGPRVVLRSGLPQLERSTTASTTFAKRAGRTSGYHTSRGRAPLRRRRLPGHRAGDVCRRPADRLDVGRPRSLEDVPARRPRRGGHGRGRSATACCCSTSTTRTTAVRSSRIRDRRATRWSLTWMVWLQDQLLTYGFFV